MENNRITVEEFHAALDTIRNYRIQMVNDHALIESVSPFIGLTKDTLLKDASLSVRVINVLNNIGVTRYQPISSLSSIPRFRLENAKNMGERSMSELTDLCFYTGVTLKK